MNLLSLRGADNVSGEATATAMTFFAALAGQRIDDARAITATDFEWFGRADIDWTGGALMRLVAEKPFAVVRPRSLSPELLDALPRTLLCQDCGSVRDGDAIILVDIERGDTTTTAGVVVSGGLRGAGRVRRIFDPQALHGTLRRLTLIRDCGRELTTRA